MSKLVKCGPCDGQGKVSLDGCTELCPICEGEGKITPEAAMAFEHDENDMSLVKTEIIDLDTGAAVAA